MSLDSASTPEAFCAREIELGTGAITATDHGSLAAIYRISALAKKNNLIAIPGIEAYFRSNDCPILTRLGIPKTDTVPRGMDKDNWKADHPDGTFYSYNKYYHITLGFQNYDAYLKGVKLLSKADDRAEIHGSERKPLFDWSDLEELAATKTTVGSGCLVGMVSRHLINTESPASVKLGAAKGYFERLHHLFGDRMIVEVFPHVCDREFSKGVFIEVGEGEAKKTLKFYYGKTLKTEDGEIKAEELADKWNGKKKLTLLAIKNFHTWTDVEVPLPIIGVRKHEGFIQNDCSPAAPGGDLQWGVNVFMMGMAKKYNLPIVVSDDCHFASPNMKIVQDVKLSQMGDWRFASSYHRYSSDEAFAHFKEKHNISEKEFESWVDNSYAFRDSFKDFKFDNTLQLPTKFYPQDTLGHTKKLIEQHGRMPKDDPRYIARLKQEIQLFHRNGTVDLLPYFFTCEEQCRLYENQGVLVGSSRGCLEGDALILTTCGYRKIRDIKVGDEVYSHQGNVRKVTNTFKYNTDEECVKLKTTYKHTPFLLTKDHKVYGFKRSKIAGLERLSKSTLSSIRVWKDEKWVPSWIEADALKVGDVVFTPRILVKEVSPDPLDLAEFVHDGVDVEESKIISRTFISEIPGGRRLGGNRTFLGKVRNGYVPPLVMKNGRKATRSILALSKINDELSKVGLTVDEWRTPKTVNHPRYINVSEDFSYLLGRWIGDGWINKEQRLGVAFNTKDRDGIEKIKAILAPYCVSKPVEVQHKTKKLVQLMASSSILCKLFRSLFPLYKNSSGTKYIPKEWLNWPKNLLKSLLLGLMDSDGHTKKPKKGKGRPSYTFDTTSVLLKDSFREALLRFGIPSSVNTREPFYRGKYLCNRSYKIEFRWSNESTIGYWSTVLSKEYSSIKEVFDLEVEHDHSFLTSEYAVHNSAGGVLLSYLLGITSIDPIQHGLSLDRFLTLDRIKSHTMPDVDLDFSNRDLLCGKDCDVVEVEAEDGTKHVLPEDFRVETEKGVLPIKKVVEENIDFVPWWNNQ
jgi:intein/homing endonuclease